MNSGIWTKVQRIEKLGEQEVTRYSPREWSTITRAISMDCFGDMQGSDAWGEMHEEKLQDIVNKIESGMPWPYATGFIFWYQWLWRIDSSALIPRSETEELLEWMQEDIPLGADCRILDVGTGSGILGIGFKLLRPSAQVTLLDVSHEALDLARSNADKLGAQVDNVQADFLSRAEWTRLGTFDLIVSNPPYIPESEKHQMSLSTLEYEPSIALFTEDDEGMEYYEALRQFGVRQLMEGGALYLEVNEFRWEKVRDLLRIDYHVECRSDLQGKVRKIKAVRK